MRVKVEEEEEEEDIRGLSHQLVVVAVGHKIGRVLEINLFIVI